jgi:RHS repeat-associated protein
LAGNFKTRTDQRQAGILETANYDALNRLTQMVGPSGAGTLTIGYDSIGNVTSRSDVNGGGTWTYHATKRNAVTAVGGPVNYAYDANGNMTSRNGVTQTWTSANLPATLATSSFSTQFSYAPDRSRFKQVATYSGGTETTLFIGGLLEMHTSGSLPTNWKHLIATPSGEVQYVRRSDSTTETYYIPSDHLGGADAVLNSAGAVIVRTSFNAWGTRRDDDWVGAPSSTELQQIANTTRHGFTGHGMLDNVGLVHMNGRVYDPAIGRFMSADPFIVPMLGTQGLNRYAYTFNSPLSYTDPSGFAPPGPDDPHTPGPRPPGRPIPPCCGGDGPRGGPNGTPGAGHDDVVGADGHVGASVADSRSDVSTSNADGGVPVQNWTDAVYLPGPIPVARYNASVFSLTVNGGLNVINSAGNLVLNSAGVILQPFDEYAGEIITFETSFPGGIAGVPVTGLLGRLSASIRMATAANKEVLAATRTQRLYHYTNERGLAGILESQELRPSLKALNPKDVRYGNGQYLSDIVPGTKTHAQLSREFLGQPFQGEKYTHFLEIDVTEFNVIQGRPGVFVIPGEAPLDLTGRIISSGAH